MTTNNDKFHFKKTALFRFTPVIILVFCILLTAMMSAGDEEKKKVIVLPLDEYTAIINDLGNSVLLPIEKYRDLLEKLADLKQLAESPQLMIVEKARYLFRPLDEMVHAEAEFAINIFRPGWHQLGQVGYDLPAGIENLEMNGSPARFLKYEDSIYIYAPNPGRAVLLMKFHQPVCQDSDTGSGLCSAILLGTNTQTIIELPFVPATNEIEGGILTSTDKNKNRTVLYIVNTESALRFSWSRRTEEATREGTGESRMISSVSSLYLVSKGLCSATDIVAVQVQKGSESEFRFLMNGKYKLTELIGEGIESYGIQNEEGKAILSVRMAKPVYDSAIFLIKTEKAEAANLIEVGPPAVIGAARQNGFIAVGSVDPITFKDTPMPSEYMKIDVRELPGEVRKLHEGEPVLGFQYRLKKDEEPKSFSLAFDFYPAGETLSSYIESAKATTLMNADGLYLNRITYELVSAGGSSFRLAVDPASTLLSAYVGDTPANAAREGNEIIIPIRSSSSGLRNNIEVVLLSKVNDLEEEGALDFVLPSVLLPVREFSWIFFLPEGYEYTDFSGNFMPGNASYIPEALIAEKPYSGTAAHAPMKKGEDKAKDEGGITSGLKEEIVIASPAPLVDAKSAVASPDFDVSSSSLSLRIVIPTEGVQMSFYSILLTAEKPEINFNYEKK
jgi:hypothetical protein